LNDKEYYVIPGFPMYSLEVNANGTANVISRHKDPLGRLLKPCSYNGITSAYKLYEKGSPRVFTMPELRSVVEREKLKSLRNAINGESMQSGQYIVGSIHKNNGTFSASPNPAVHLSISAAKAEAARLAGISKEKKFVVLKLEGIASVEEVVWR
jgi:hypothetical protein